MASQSVASNAAWTFGGKVPETFTDHVKRSVSCYNEDHDLICRISDFFVGKGFICYDLGTSKNKLADHSNKSARFIGLDLEEEMIAHAHRVSKHICFESFLCIK